MTHQTFRGDGLIALILTTILASDCIMTHSSDASSRFQNSLSLQELVVDLLPSPQRCLDLIHELLPQLASEAYQAFIAQVCHKHSGCLYTVN